MEQTPAPYKTMDGELAVITQGGNQIGGLFYWEINTLYESNIKDGWYEHKIKRNITARSYWLNVAPEGHCFEIQFYKAYRGQLVLMGEGGAEVYMTDKTLNRRLYAPIEIRWV